MKILIGGIPFAAHDLRCEAMYIGTVLAFAEIIPDAEFAFLSECPHYICSRFELDSRRAGDFEGIDLYVVLAGTYLIANMPLALSLMEEAAKAGVASVVFDWDLLPGDPLFQRTFAERYAERSSWQVRLRLKKEDPEMARAFALQEIFSLARAVLVRNSRTFVQLQHFGFEPAGINIDPLYLLPSGDLERAKEVVPEAFWKTLASDGRLLVISFALPPEEAKMTEWNSFFTGFLTENPANCIAFFCPECEQYRASLFGEEAYSPAVQCFSDYPEPEILQAFLSFANAVIADRREVLIFAANSLIPFFALKSDDGSVEPMLEEYGVTFCGSIANPDFEKLSFSLGLLLTGGEAMTTELARVRARILKRKLPLLLDEKNSHKEKFGEVTKS